MQLNRIKAVRGYKAPRRIAGRPSVVAPNRVQRGFTVVRANQVWVTDKESTSFREWRMCAPSMGAILEVKVLPRADHSERKEVQLREGDRAWGGSTE